MTKIFTLILLLYFFICCIDNEEKLVAPPAPPSYKSYFTGDKADVITQPQGGVCLMSGGGEDDEAMRWFLRRSGGGDVVVLRASGSDGYNDYMYKDLSVKVNSVESIVFQNEAAARDSYVLKQIANAEAIWFAGGDQWNYVKYWRGTAVDSIINYNIANKKIVVGGLSAGMAILGTPYFSAALGSITSDDALQNPLSDMLSVHNDAFLKIPYLQNIITDTHYANRNRQGRHIAFLAKAYTQFGIAVKGIACDEESAICVDNDYMYKDLIVKVNSIESIVFQNEAAARDSYVLKQIANAEAIWFAGGDQWNYVKYWRGTAVDSIINYNIANKKIVVGGLSAGMAILGTPYFSAALGSISSVDALQNPLSDVLSVHNDAFLKIPYLQNIITDTHYANRNRQGRHIAFLAKAYTQFGINVKGIACDEESAICVDNDGKAYVYGAYPKKEHAAYFIQINCELSNAKPEVMIFEKPLHWVRDSSALKVYEIKAESDGKHYFDLKDWKTGSGGAWKHWYVVNGEWKVGEGTKPDCK